CADQDVLVGGSLDRPRPAPVFAAGEQMLFRLVVVDVMPGWSEVFVIARTEADQDFVSPRPNPMIRRPTSKAARLVVDLDVLDTDRLIPAARFGDRRDNNKASGNKRKCYFG